MGHGWVPTRRLRRDRRTIPPAWALAILLAMTGPLLMAGTAAPAGAQSNDVPWARIPTLEVGDHWSYVLEGREEGTIHNEVRAREIKENHYGLSVDSLRIHIWGIIYTDYSEHVTPPVSQSGLGAASGPRVASTENEITADKWVRHDDHALVQTEGTVRISGSASATILEAFSPPLVHAVYPFATGYEWIARADRHIDRGAEETPDTSVDLIVKVLSYERVTVPAGTFDTWKTEHNSFRSGGRVVQWWSQEACGLVKEEQFDKNQELQNTMQLTDHSCRGDHGTEPNYTGRGVILLTTGGNGFPPWLSELPPMPDPNGPGILQRASLLPGGVVLWVAVAMIAAASVLFIVVGRRRA